MYKYEKVDTFETTNVVDHDLQQRIFPTEDLPRPLDLYHVIGDRENVLQVRKTFLFPCFEVGNKESIARRWDTYVARFDNGMRALNITDPVLKKELLLQWGGRELHDVYVHLPPSKQNKCNVYEQCRYDLTQYFSSFRPKTDHNFNIYKFRKLRQRTNEGIEEFHTRVMRQAVVCNFADINFEVKNQIILGCANYKLRHRALNNDEMTLREILARGAVMEVAERVESVMTNHYQTNHGGMVGGPISNGNVVEVAEAAINVKLPKELLLRIFSFLDVVSLCRCAQVSRSWNILALDGSNWQHVDLFNFQIDVDGAVVENISSRCRGFLKSLSLRGCQNITDSALKLFASQCHNVESFNLNECKKITDVTCHALGKHCHKLSHLDLGSCACVTNLSMRHIGEGCPGLTHLNISWCQQVTDDGIVAIGNNCHRLTVFIAKGCNQLTDHGIQRIAANCPDLSTLNLHSCISITDELVIIVSDNCHNLHNLCVTNCSRLTDASLVALSQGCVGLRTLEVTGCSQFTDSGFQALARTCHELERMDLEECVQITDATLNYLAMNCPLLAKLSLSHCELVTDEGIRQLGIGPCATESLAVLELDNCPLITDASLEHLAGCQNLQRIELYDCQLITRAGIRRLRSHLPNIKVHAYFAPVTPPPSVGGSRRRYCKCCVIL